MTFEARGTKTLLLGNQHISLLLIQIFPPYSIFMNAQGLWSPRFSEAEDVKYVDLLNALDCGAFWL